MQTNNTPENNTATYENMPHQQPCQNLSPLNSLWQMENRARFLSYLQLVLKAVFILFLFLEGMFNLDYMRKSYSTFTKSHGSFPQSFSDVAREDVLLIGTDYSIPNEFCHVLFYVMLVFIAADFIFSILRAVKPEFTRKWKWQLVIPALIFVIFTVSSVVSCFYCKVDIYEFYDRTENHTLFWTKHLIDHGIKPEQNYSVEALHQGTIGLGFLFYITLLLGIIILAIDFYVMFMSDPHSKIKTVSKEHNLK